MCDAGDQLLINRGMAPTRGDWQGKNTTSLPEVNFFCEQLRARWPFESFQWKRDLTRSEGNLRGTRSRRHARNQRSMELSTGSDSEPNQNSVKVLVPGSKPTFLPRTRECDKDSVPTSGCVCTWGSRLTPMASSPVLKGKDKSLDTNASGRQARNQTFANSPRWRLVEKEGKHSMLKPAIVLSLILQDCLFLPARRLAPTGIHRHRTHPRLAHTLRGVTRGSMKRCIWPRYVP